MSVGLEIFNNNNRLIINESFKNLCLQRTYINTDKRWIPLAQDELAAFFVGDGIAVWGGREQGGIMFKVYGTSSTNSLTVYVFGERMKRGPLGLQTFDEAGNVIFDSNNKFMQVIDFKHHTKVLDPYNVHYPGEVPRYHYANNKDIMKHGVDYWLGQEYVYNKKIAIIPLNMPSTDCMDGEMWWERANGVIRFSHGGRGIRLEKNIMNWAYSMMPTSYYHAPIDCMSFLVVDIEGM